MAHTVRKHGDDSWCLAHCLLSAQSGTATRGMVLPTFRACLPVSVKLPGNILTDTPSSVLKLRVKGRPLQPLIKEAPGRPPLPL